MKEYLFWWDNGYPRKTIFWWYRNWTNGYYPPIAINWKESIMFAIIRLVRKLKGEFDLAA